MPTIFYLEVSSGFHEILFLSSLSLKVMNGKIVKEVGLGYRNLRCGESQSLQFTVPDRIIKSMVALYLPARMIFCLLPFSVKLLWYFYIWYLGCSISGEMWQAHDFPSNLRYFISVLAFPFLYTFTSLHVDTHTHTLITRNFRLILKTSCISFLLLLLQIIKKLMS